MALQLALHHFVSQVMSYVPIAVATVPVVIAAVAACYNSRIGGRR